MHKLKDRFGKGKYGTVGASSPGKGGKLPRLDPDVVPPKEEVDKKFTEILDELSVSESERQAIMQDPIEEKWAFICLYDAHRGEGEKGNKSESPQFFLHNLKQAADVNILLSGQLLVKTKGKEWVAKLMEFGGMEALLEILAAQELKKQPTDQDYELQMQALRFLRVIIATQPGLQAFIESRYSVRNVVLFILYRPSIAILGSREQLCIHPEVSQVKGNIQNTMCRSKVIRKRCDFHEALGEFKKAGNLPDELCDIEDLIRIGKENSVCPFYLSREMYAYADVIFMPYNYLIDPQLRQSLSVDVSGSVLILDEGHNLEQWCSDASSFDFTSVLLAQCIAEVNRCINIENSKETIDRATDDKAREHSAILASMKSMLLELEETIDAAQVGKEGLTKGGDFIFELFANIGINSSNFNMYIDCVDEAIKTLVEARESSGSGRANSALQMFMQTLKTVFAEDHDSEDIKSYYKVHIHPDEKRMNLSRDDLVEYQAARNGRYKDFDKGRTLSFWCFNPGLAMRSIKKMNPLSIILTSGTLSPMDSFAFEFQMEFPIRLENPHVINPEQVCVMVAQVGPAGTPLNSSFKTRGQAEYKTELGNTIVNIARIVPDGLLVFFPSYTLLAGCIEAWKTVQPNQQRSIWDNISRCKLPVIEPRDSSKLKEAIQQYEEHIANPYTDGTNGAVFFAVCRGKVSEGLDFANKNGRAVVITGIPYPSKHDPKVVLKKQYVDLAKTTNKSQTMTGNDWYMQQASRAVNQAIGRVIRHRYDYGAIILCDERFASQTQVQQLSRWLRPHVKKAPQFGEVIKNLTGFFKKAAVMYPVREAPKPQNTDTNNNSSGNDSMASLRSYDPFAQSNLSLREAAGKVSLASIPQGVRQEFKAPRQTTVVNKQEQRPVESATRSEELSTITFQQRLEQSKSSLLGGLSKTNAPTSSVALSSSAAATKQTIQTPTSTNQAEGNCSSNSSTVELAANVGGSTTSQGRGQKPIQIAQQQEAKVFLTKAKELLTTEEYGQFKALLVKFKTSFHKTKEAQKNADGGSAGAPSMTTVFTELVNQVKILFGGPNKRELLHGFQQFIPPLHQPKYREIIEQGTEPTKTSSSSSPRLSVGQPSSQRSSSQNSQSSPTKKRAHKDLQYDLLTGKTTKKRSKLSRKSGSGSDLVDISSSQGSTGGHHSGGDDIDEDVIIVQQSPVVATTTTAASMVPYGASLTTELSLETDILMRDASPQLQQQQHNHHTLDYSHNNSNSNINTAHSYTNNSDSGEGGDTNGGGLMCPVCADKVRVPWAARCGHIACFECWEKWLKQKLECPTCRERTRQKQLRKLYLT